MLIGGLILVAMPNKTIKMRQVCIDENFQRKGYGEYLELQAEKWAKNKGFELMFCHARENALSFYQKLNYLQKGEPFEEVGLVHYYLEKQL